MARLNDAIRRTIVIELACFRTPSEVAEIVKEVHGVEISRQLAHTYDPHGSAGADVAKKWKALHAATREAFLKDTSAIPAAQRAYRLRELSDAAQRAKTRGNIPLMAQLLEQCAKESGDVFTNKVNHNLRGAIGTFEMSEEQVDAELAALMGGGNAASGA